MPAGRSREDPMGTSQQPRTPGDALEVANPGPNRCCPAYLRSLGNQPTFTTATCPTCGESFAVIPQGDGTMTGTVDMWEWEG
jgi:hypothetical protein